VSSTEASDPSRIDPFGIDSGQEPVTPDAMERCGGVRPAPTRRSRPVLEHRLVERSGACFGIGGRRGSLARTRLWSIRSDKELPPGRSAGAVAATEAARALDVPSLLEG